MIIISEANVNAASEEILAVDKIDIDDDILVESNVSTVSEVDSDAQDLSLLGLEKEKPVNDLVGMDHRDQDEFTLPDTPDDDASFGAKSSCGMNLSSKVNVSKIQVDTSTSTNRNKRKNVKANSFVLSTETP
jgi:hypothetical protein